MFIINGVYVLIRYPLKDEMFRFPDEHKRWGGTSVGCQSFLVLAQAEMLSILTECLESVPFPLQSVSFHCSGGDVFAWRPEGKGQALWPCESRPSVVRGRKGIGCKPQRHTHGFHVQFQRQSCLLAACYH